MIFNHKKQSIQGCENKIFKIKFMYIFSNDCKQFFNSNIFISVNLYQILYC